MDFFEFRTAGSGFKSAYIFFAANYLKPFCIKFASQKKRTCLFLHFFTVSTWQKKIIIPVRICQSVVVCAVVRKNLLYTKVSSFNYAKSDNQILPTYIKPALFFFAN